MDGELPDSAEQYAQLTFDAVAHDIDKAIDTDHRAFDEHGTEAARWALTRHIYLENAYYTVPGAASIHRGHVCIKMSQVVGWTIGITVSQ